MTLILVKVDVKKISKKIESPGPDIKINKAGDRKKYSVKSPLSSSLLLISKMLLFVNHIAEVNAPKICGRNHLAATI